MFDHLSFAVANLAMSGRFYDAALAPLGCLRVWSTPGAVGYGLPGGEDRFAIKQRESKVIAPGRGFHLAFIAPSSAAVDAFYHAAVANGGTDNGPPGLRAQYGPNYYAAFVVDPDGYAIEAVCHQSPLANDP